ncbi:MAG TPA: archease [Gemmatimonadaceae bacterium]|nr:archease [Gemmatimonadaceae bacterium]
MTTPRAPAGARRAGVRRRGSARTRPHVGEWNVTLSGATRERIFARVATLIAHAAGRAGDSAGDWESVAVTAPDEAALLVDWANELIGRGEASGLAYADLRDVAVLPPAPGASPHWRVTAQVRGRPVVEWRSPLKAATYHGATLVQRDGRWHATLLFDI